MPAAPVVVTFDLFSALIDSRAGAGAVLGSFAAERDWPIDGGTVYDRWDALVKQAHRDCRTWVPHVVLAREAMRDAYAELGLTGDPAADVETVYDALPQWPLWPDVADALPEIARRFRVGVLSNVDDALFDRTQVAPLVDRELLLSSQRLQCYKPDARIYLRARELAGPLVHVATSARDVRGALESGLPVVRLRRPGHRLDPAGPSPALEAGGLQELAALLPQPAADAAVSRGSDRAQTRRDAAGVGSADRRARDDIPEEPR